MKNMNELIAADRAIWNDTPIGEWLDACFYDNETGEFFFVEIRKSQATMEEFIADCAEIANDNFDNANYVNLVSGEHAEILGYDTY